MYFPILPFKNDVVPTKREIFFSKLYSVVTVRHRGEGASKLRFPSRSHLLIQTTLRPVLAKLAKDLIPVTI